jgi:uncharacterized protein YciI
MKTILLMVLIVLSTTIMAQSVQQKDSLFVVYYTTGPSWDHAKAPAEQAYFADHSKHLAALRKDGVIKMGARAGEKGIVIVSAESLEKAQSLINSDTAIVHQLFTTEIQRFNVFYPGCVER